MSKEKKSGREMGQNREIKKKKRSGFPVTYNFS